MNVKFVQCQTEGCGWRETVNGRPGAERACRDHRDERKHRVFLYIQATEIRP